MHYDTRNGSAVVHRKFHGVGSCGGASTSGGVPLRSASISNDPAVFVDPGVSRENNTERKKRERPETEGETAGEDTRKKKGRKLPSLAGRRTLSVGEEELRDLDPSVEPRDNNVPDRSPEGERDVERLVTSSEKREKDAEGNLRDTLGERDNSPQGSQEDFENLAGTPLSEGRHTRRSGDTTFDRSGHMLARSMAQPPRRSDSLLSGSSRTALPDKVSFEFGRELPLSSCPWECARLIRQIRGGPDDLPSVEDLAFKDYYERAARSPVRKNANMEKGKVAAAEFHRKEMARLRDSRVIEVTKERVKVQTEMISKATPNDRGNGSSEVHHVDPLVAAGLVDTPERDCGSSDEGESGQHLCWDVVDPDEQPAESRIQGTEEALGENSEGTGRALRETRSLPVDEQL
ncbi:hypothetical protein Bca52824_018005 [Brassica carinata]|uniref:Uncharacterized protein n=1 Tax=Brassica carinata TaxID=52824 RepID=A0A8X7VN41_BRACI|nr:hypothetical protein Bca52824_018005 [Brassica carinata]